MTQKQVTAVGLFCNRNVRGAHLPPPGAARTGGSVPLKLQSPFPVLPLPKPPQSEPSSPLRCAEPALGRIEPHCPQRRRRGCLDRVLPCTALAPQLRYLVPPDAVVGFELLAVL